MHGLINMIFDVLIPDCFPKAFLLLYVILVSFIYKYNTTYYIFYSMAYTPLRGEVRGGENLGMSKVRKGQNSEL